MNLHRRTREGEKPLTIQDLERERIGNEQVEQARKERQRRIREEGGPETPENPETPDVPF